MRFVLLFLIACTAAPVILGQDEMSVDVTIMSPDGKGIAIKPTSTRPNVDAVKLETFQDLCDKKNCQIGEVCVINNDEPLCECNERCEIPEDDRQKICTTSNHTYDSDCHFLRELCWCRNEDAKCRRAAILDEKLDYYGACKALEQCSSEHKLVFPNRMKIWLDEILHILNERENLDPKYYNLVKLADEMKANHSQKYWTAGVAFEFCQLDKNFNHNIEQLELRSLLSTIKSLESCIQPFLEECDRDKDGLIGDDEWAHCLDLSDADLELLRKFC